MNPQDKFLVCLYSDPNFLATNLLESLIANNCFVNIITGDVEGWQRNSTNIASNKRFSILPKKNIKSLTNYSYVICCVGFLNKDKTRKDLNYFLENIDLNKSKILLIFPSETYGIINSGYLDDIKNVGVVYVSDLVGPRMDLESNLRMSRYFKEIISNNRLSIPVGETLHPLFVNDAAKQITQWLFSFGPYGKEVFLKGEEISDQSFWLAVEKSYGGIEYISVQRDTDINLPKHIETNKLKNNIDFILKETFQWFSKNRPKISRAKHISKITKPKPSNYGKEPYDFKMIFTTAVVILLLPLILLASSVGLTYLAYKQFLRGNTDATHTLLKASKLLSNVNYFESRGLKYIPLLGVAYRETEYLSDTIIHISDLSESAIPLIKKTGTLLDSLLQNNTYSVESMLTDSSTQLQEIYSEIVWLENKSKEGKDKGVYSAEQIASKINFSSYKNIILQMINVYERLPYILGEYQNKTYLVLFQNNMELRPTGGFIGSFGLITFDKGRLSEFNVSDVYSADGQLKGHVDPPTPIKNYLGEANWWFRDSNWDPDFPISAKRAEWFLDKEIDKQVDGVIAIDLKPIQDFLKLNGGIYLSDYDLNITDINLYEEVQSEVQDNSFPGTHQKASFLTALSRSILNEASMVSFSDKIGILKLFYDNLEERHVQVYIHDGIFQESLSQLNWDGSVFVPSCDEGCFSDMVGIVEANLGVNKSNFFVKRNIETFVNIDEDIIKRTLILTVENGATAGLGPSGRYKSYIRLLVPQNSTDIQVTSEYGQDIRILDPDIVDAKGRKEIGVIFETLAGDTKKLQYSWSTRLDKAINSYNLYIRKQAGVDEIPFVMSVHTPFNILGSNLEFTLTEDSNYLYNTTLTRDLSARLSL